MKNKKIIPMAERQYQLIPIDSIVVLNSRNRNRQKFAENVRSIDEVGLRKPIVVNGRGFPNSGKYELVCGEGRFLAHKELGRDEIPAEVIDCDRKTALLYSLVENIARVPPGTMWFAYEMKRMYDAGLNYTEISRYVGKSSTYVSSFIQLVNNGEDRLLVGVEQGLFSMSFAVQVAQSDDTTIQHVLMDAFDDGMVNCNSVRRVRKLLELRMSRGKGSDKRNRRAEGFTLKELKHEITKSTKEKADYVRVTQQKENRLMMLLIGMSAMMEDPEGMKQLTNFGLAEPPALQGTYAIDLRASKGAVQ